MPQSVPKVPYRNPKDRRIQWVEIFNVLVRPGAPALCLLVDILSCICLLFILKLQLQLDTLGWQAPYMPQLCAKRCMPYSGRRAQGGT